MRNFLVIDEKTIHCIQQKLHSIKKQINSQLKIAKNEAILDVGCAGGLDCNLIVQNASCPHPVIGIDNNINLILGTKKEKAFSLGDSHPLFLVGDVHKLPFNCGSFHLCRCERVLQHLLNPLEAIEEMIRVTKRSGHIAIIESDHLSLSFGSGIKAIEKDYVQARAKIIRNGWIVTEIEKILVEKGLRIVKREKFRVTINDLNEARNFRLLLEEIGDGLGIPVSKKKYKLLFSDLSEKQREGKFSVTSYLVLVVAQVN